MLTDVLVLLIELRPEIFEYRQLARPSSLNNFNMSNSELACVYAALILADDDVAISGEKIHTILKAAKVEVEPYWPGLFAKALEGVNVKDLLSNVGSGVGAAGAAAPAAGGAAAAAPAAKEEAKKEESAAEESDDDMGFGLFD